MVSPAAQSSLCHLASFTFFSLNSRKKKKKAKNSINKPLRSGTLLLWHTRAHSFQRLDEKQRDKPMECAEHSLSQMGPFEIYDPASALPTLYTSLGETGTSFPRVREGSSISYLRKNARQDSFKKMSTWRVVLESW